MGIRTRTVSEGTCDECGKEIDTEDNYIDAGTYGMAFHPECWAKIGGPRVARVLYLDDIWVRRGEDGIDRAWGPAK